jgi:MFS family permease
MSEAKATPAVGTALRLPGYRVHFTTYLIGMMADNIEHVISYWVAFQKFRSASLGGFAVLSHWLPFLGFSVWVGALNDRYDSRRLIQIAMVMFMTASAGWGYFIWAGSLEMWHAMLLLVLHGCAGVLWQTSNQMLIYDIVGPAMLPSAVRLNATARYLGFLVGPAVGGAMMLGLGPVWGLVANTLFYVPLLVWLIRAPYGRHHRAPGAEGAPPRRAVRGFADIMQTLRDVRSVPVMAAMLMLAGGASFFIGSGYGALMPAFASDLGHGDQGALYSMLLGADAAGALTAGVVLETTRSVLATTPRNAIALSLLWAASLFAFAWVTSYPIALVLLFCAGFFELSFSSMAQTIVQLNAPDRIRGRVLGLFNMSALGLRAFSGITVGLVGGWLDIHISLALASVGFIAVMSAVWLRQRRRIAA